MDIDINEFTELRAQQLQKFLTRPDRPQNTMSYYQTAGFLFAVCCSPEPVAPSEWLPLIFDEQEASYQDMQEAKDILGSLMSLYNWINGGVIERQAALPPGFVLHETAIENLEPEAHLSQWSRGFMEGHSWLEESWDDYTPEELDDELGALEFVLFFFAHRKLAEGFRQEMSPDKSLDELATDVMRLFKDSMNGYAHLGRSISETIMEFESKERETTRGTRPGRNDPCPCGSGRKYKRCCGADA